MKYLILSLMVFSSFQAFSRSVEFYFKGCDKTNYTKFINNPRATDDLVLKTYKGCVFFKDDFRWANFKKAYLRDADFSESTLNGANFYKAILPRSTFFKAKLYGTNFKEADLLKVNFNNANLSGANFAGANLTGASFTGAILIEAVFPKKYRNLLTKKQQGQVQEIL